MTLVCSSPSCAATIDVHPDIAADVGHVLARRVLRLFGWTVVTVYGKPCAVCPRCQH